MERERPAMPPALAAGPWDGFRIGPENRLAHAAAVALARGDGPGLSPLVIHGPSGAGKSRLLAGLAAEWRARRPEAPIELLPAEDFATLCHQANEAPGGWAALRRRFRTAELLALDDLHDLARSPLALAELVPTLDALEESGAAVAVTARSAPGGWTDLPARLVSRLACGLSARLDPPGLDARRRYVLEGSRRRGLSLPAAAVERLAEAADGYRTLDGLLARLGLEATAARRAPADALNDALDEPGARAGPPAIAAVARAVAARFGIPLHVLRGPTRRAAVVGPRHLAIHLARVYTGGSFAAIGAYFGRRDPATIRHACAMAASRLAADPALAAAAAALAAAWRTPTADGDPGPP